ncbi:MAG: hypothetical protein WCK89_21115, partial [bacterium]
HVYRNFSNALGGVAMLRCSSPAFQPVQDMYVTTVGLGVTILSPAASPAGMTNLTSLLLAQGVAYTNDVSIPSGVSYNWSATPGNGVKFNAPSAPLTGVRFPANGNYAVQLSASFGNLSASNSFEVRVGGADSYLVPAAPLIPQVGLVQASASSFQLNWQDGQLQASTNLVDWADVPFIASPFVISPVVPTLFWRVRQP